MQRRVIPLSRAVEARLVPTGDPIRIPGGAFVTVSTKRKVYISTSGTVRSPSTRMIGQLR